MEINKYQDITGVVAMEDIVEGRMVVLDEHSVDGSYGSKEDLPGARLPDTAADSSKAHYCITFAVERSAMPIYVPYPSVSNTSLRWGFDGSSNVPFSADVYLTAPSMKEGATIPSGYTALAFGPGVFTVPSGHWVYSASVVPGAFLSVCNTAEDGASDAGKLKYSATETFIQCVNVDSKQRLTFRIMY